MKFSSRIAAAAFGVALCGAALAQQYPSQPIRLVTPVAAGGPTDILSRAVAPRLGEALGQQVIVENRPGAGGLIATEFVARAAPDGYTLFVADISFAANPSLYKSAPYSSTDNFVPVGLMATSSLVLVVPPSVAAHNIKELVALARSQPGKLSYGAAAGTPTHFGPEVLKEAHDLDILFVPYKGIAPALTDLVAGRITFAMLSIPPAMGFMKAGKLRALAITGTRRFPILPDVPTFAEAGVPLPDMDNGSWWGIVAPARVPGEIVRKLNATLNKALSAPDVASRLTALTFTPGPGSPEAFGAFIQKEVPKWARVIQRAGIKAN